MVIGKGISPKSTTLLGIFLPIVVLWVCLTLPATATACTMPADTGDDGGQMIQVTGHELRGGSLVITYTIRYPGMTKVKLFNGNNELLWRGQHVDDKEGEHEFVFKASVLNPGNYMFEFDYKNQIQNYRLSM